MTEPLMTSEALAELVVRSPFHQWLQLTLASIDAEGVTLALRWREEMLGHPVRRYIHGGILATIIDAAGDYAVAARVGRGVPTVTLTVDYHRPAVEQDLTARGTIVWLGGTLAAARAEITDRSGALIATGRGLYVTSQSR